VNDIDQFIEEAGRKQRFIYTSTIAFAEIKPQHLRKRQYGDIFRFFEEFKSAFRPIGTSPDILARAGQLRELEFSKDGGTRSVGMGDAVHLLTCQHLKADIGVKDIVFHTLDEGKGKTWEGRCVPLLGFETWCKGHENNDIVKSIIALPRHKPAHPQPRMFPAS
jgi:hypothetical protein